MEFSALGERSSGDLGENLSPPPSGSSPGQPEPLSGYPTPSSSSPTPPLPSQLHIPPIPSSPQPHTPSSSLLHRSSAESDQVTFEAAATTVQRGCSGYSSLPSSSTSSSPSQATWWPGTSSFPWSFQPLSSHSTRSAPRRFIPRPPVQPASGEQLRPPPAKEVPELLPQPPVDLLPVSSGQDTALPSGFPAVDQGTVVPSLLTVQGTAGTALTIPAFPPLFSNSNSNLNSLPSTAQPLTQPSSAPLTTPTQTLGHVSLPPLLAATIAKQPPIGIPLFGSYSPPLPLHPLLGPGQTGASSPSLLGPRPAPSELNTTAPSPPFKTAPAAARQSSHGLERKQTSATSGQSSLSPSQGLPKLPFVPLPRRVIGTHEGRPAVCFTDRELSLADAEFQHSVVLKFAQGNPPLARIRKTISEWGLSSPYSVGLLDHRHAFVHLTSQADLSTALATETRHIDNRMFRRFRWTPEFSPHKESSLAVVWITLPHLPVRLYFPSFLQCIGDALGMFLQLDAPTLSMTKPKLARLCIEIDCSLPLPDRIWIAYEKGGGHWQRIEYEKPPIFCSTCHRLGHSLLHCRRSIAAQQGGNVTPQPVHTSPPATSTAPPTPPPHVPPPPTTSASFSATESTRTAAVYPLSSAAAAVAPLSALQPLIAPPPLGAASPPAPHGAPPTTAPATITPAPLTPQHTAHPTGAAACSLALPLASPHLSTAADNNTPTATTANSPSSLLHSSIVEGPTAGRKPAKKPSKHFSRQDGKSRKRELFRLLREASYSPAHLRALIDPSLTHTSPG